MDKNIKIVFSDESGSWAESQYYVRSWIFWNIDDYIEIENKYIEKINRHKSLLSWENKHLKTELEQNDQDEIFGKIDKVYITFTIIKEFKEKKLKVREDVLNLLSSHPSLKGKSYEEYLINNVSKAVNKTLFLYLYESIHFRSFLDKLDSSSYYFLILDEPSQLDPKHHQKIWKESAFHLDRKIKLIISKNDSELSLGLQIADCFAGAINDFLLNRGNHAENFLRKYKSKFFDNKSINKIMWEGDQDYQLEEIIRINKFFNEE
jgi:hypothetical protein